MKLLFIHDGPIYFDENGNYYRNAYSSLKEYYSSLGDEITFLMRTTSVVGGVKECFVPRDIFVISIPEFKKPQFYLRRIVKVNHIIEDAVKKADIVILRTGSVANIAVKYVRKYCKPYIYECVGCTWDALWNYSILGKVLAPFSFLRTKRIIKKSPYVYYVTNGFLQKRYPTNGKSIGCSDVLLKMHDNSVFEKRLEKIKKNRGKIVLGTAAALNVKYKGQRFIIQALAELKKQGITNFEYQVIGGGDSSSLVKIAEKYGVSDQFKVIGRLNHDKVFDWLESIDVYVQPSLTEGLPRAMIEAMSCGLPCMGTNIGGIPELIDKSMLFSKKNVKQIAELLKNINKEKMIILAEQNFTKSKEFDKNVLEKKRRIFYTEFIKSIE